MPDFGMPIKVVILFGPTASGKTALAEKLFTGSHALCRAEIISADSMQVYRGMDIGTAKPDSSLLEKLPHHLINIRNPDEQFNTGDFVRLADEACSEIKSRSALPVILGGTGFYLKNFIFGLPASPRSDPALRENLKREFTQKGPEIMLQRLYELDPVSAERIHLNDSYRLIRALEVCISSGKPLSSFAQQNRKRPEYDFIIAGLRFPRNELYRRIDKRCDDMFRLGLAEEVESLYQKGYSPDDPGLRAIGYREFFILNEENYPKWRLSRDMEGVKALIAGNSRRYAKRQETFFASIQGTSAGTQNSEGSPPGTSAERAAASEGSPPDITWISGMEDTKTAIDLLSSLIHTDT